MNGTTTGRAIAANKSAKFHIHTQNEWYKAAYYSPRLDSGNGGYYVFAAQNNATPRSVTGNNIIQRNKPNQANYFNGGFAVTQAITPSASQIYLTDGGTPGQATKCSLRGAYWVSNVADTPYLDEYILPPIMSQASVAFVLPVGKLSKNNQRDKPKKDPLIGPLSRSSKQHDAITNIMHLNRQQLLNQRDWPSRVRLASLHSSLLETSKIDLFAASSYPDDEGRFLTDSPLSSSSSTLANRTVLDALWI